MVETKWALCPLFIFGTGMREQISGLDELIRPSVEAMGYELVGVEFLSPGSGGTLRIYIDGATGITVDDCERVSRQVSSLLDVEDPIPGAYTLEVSSPGLDRPLFTPEHFQRFAGETVKIRLEIPMEGRRKLKGRLLGWVDDHVVVEEDGREISVPLQSIGRANLVPRLDLNKH